MARKSGGIHAGRLEEVIERLYAAALDETSWQGAVADVSAMFGGVGTIVVRCSMAGGLGFNWIQEHVPAVEGRWDHYMAYHDVDIRTAHCVSNPAGTIYADQDFIDDRAIDRHPFYQEFMATYDLRYTLGSRFEVDGGEIGIVNVFRNRRQGHLERPEADLMEAVLPHLARACRIDQRLASARRSERHLRDALDRVPDAIFLVTGAGRIVDANRAGERLLRRREGLSALQSQLSAGHPAARKALAAAIAAAAERRRTRPWRVRCPCRGRWAGPFRYW